MKRRQGIHQIDPKSITFANQGGAGFINPRHFHKAHVNGAPQGLDDESLTQLFEDIVERGVTKPLILRASGGSWSGEGNQLVDGERRLLCSIKGDLPAVPCYIYDDMTDEEAWMVAWRENDTGKAIGENATAALVKHWREQGWVDDKILAVTKRTTQWLRQMDVLGQLDPESFDAFTKGCLSLRVALKLAMVEEMPLRHELLNETLNDAKADHSDWLAKQKKIISRIEDKMESAEARLAAARVMGSEEEQQEAQEELSRQEEALQEANQALQDGEESHPTAKAKNLARASKKVGARQVASALSKAKLKKCLKQMDEYIENDGMDTEDNYVGELEHLKIIRFILNNILVGNDDFKQMLAEYYEKASENSESYEDEEEEEEAIYDEEDSEEAEDEADEDENDGYDEEDEDVENEEVYEQLRKSGVFNDDE